MIRKWLNKNFALIFRILLCITTIILSVASAVLISILALIFSPAVYIITLLDFSILALTIGLMLFSIITFSGKKMKRRYFIFSQILIFSGLILLMWLTDVTNTKKIFPYGETISYFEMGSFSLLITAIILSKNIEDKNDEFVRSGFLTLISTLIFFFFGVILILLNTFSLQVDSVKYFQNSGFFLASYDLLFAVMLLIRYYVKKYPSLFSSF